MIVYIGRTETELVLKYRTIPDPTGEFAYFHTGSMDVNNAATELRKEFKETPLRFVRFSKLESDIRMLDDNRFSDFLGAYERGENNAEV